jgi:hypothetical protein
VGTYSSQMVLATNALTEKARVYFFILRQVGNTLSKKHGPVLRVRLSRPKFQPSFKPV